MESVLKTNGIVKKYGSNTVLNGINMTINKGNIYGFIGARITKNKEVK